MAVLTVFGVLLLGGAQGAAASGGGCKGANAPAHTVPLSELRGAMTCLINHICANHNLHRLNTNADLQQAAQGHNRTMLKEQCFSHQCPGEADLEHRIKRTGYFRGARAWGFGENLGFDTTTKELVDCWMSAPSRCDQDTSHRENVLDKKFRDIGVGVSWGAPCAPSCTGSFDPNKLATYTVDFGFRKG